MTELIKILVPVLIFATAKARIDYEIIRSGNPINHGIEWVVWAVLTVVTDWLFELNFLVLPLQSTLSALYFDMALNAMRGRKLLYVGFTAWTDRMFQKLPNPPVSALILKIVLIILTAWMYTQWK